MLQQSLLLSVILFAYSVGAADVPVTVSWQHPAGRQAPVDVCNGAGSSTPPPGLIGYTLKAMKEADPYTILSWSVGLGTSVTRNLEAGAHYSIWLTATYEVDGVRAVSADSCVVLAYIPVPALAPPVRVRATVSTDIVPARVPDDELLSSNDTYGPYAPHPAEAWCAPEHWSLVVYTRPDDAGSKP